MCGVDAMGSIIGLVETATGTAGMWFVLPFIARIAVDQCVVCVVCVCVIALFVINAMARSSLSAGQRRERRVCSFGCSTVRSSQFAAQFT